MLDILKKAGLNEATVRLAYALNREEGRKAIRRVLIAPGIREDDLKRKAKGSQEKFDQLKADRDAWIMSTIRFAEELLNIDDD